MLKVGVLPCIFLFFIGSHSLALHQVTVESRVSTTQYKSILNYFRMKRVYIEFEVAPANRAVEGFNWGPEKEGTQMDEYLAWHRTNITLPEARNFIQLPTVTPS